MAASISLLLLALATVGVVLVGIQVAYAVRHVAQPFRPPRVFEAISILKPLCGVDDDLLRNLQGFAQLRYPRYEVLLGVEDVRDPAYSVACAAVARWPATMRVIVQRGAPGLNPKVNQLITLSRHARHELLVISDSNVAVPADYLTEIASHFEDEGVGVVTHAIAGVGERSWGALLDNLHMSSAIGPGIIAANKLGRNALVVGKSMAFRRDALRTIGGFEAVKDVLAEDYIMGRMLARLGEKRVAVAHRPIMNVTRRRTAHQFFERYARWSIMQRKSVGNALYTAQLLLNPTPFALVAWAIDRTGPTLVALSLCAAVKVALEGCALRAMRPDGFSSWILLALPLKDVLLLCAWAAGLCRDEVLWRGHRLRVLAGTQLVPVAIARARPRSSLGRAALGRSAVRAIIRVSWRARQSMMYAGSRPGRL